MGACTFYNYARRDACQTGTSVVQEGRYSVHRPVYGPWPSARDAFERLTTDSRYESGHSYSGEIGMKHDFIHIATVDDQGQADALAAKMINDCDPRINDKWGPAGCITIREGPYQFLFFGWASS